jgi:hypothetical protein
MRVWSAAVQEEPVVPSELRRALADRAYVPRASGPEAHSSALFRAHVLEKVGRMFAEGGVEGLLVKGAALALTVYEEPAARLMADIDLLVRPGESDRVVAALVDGGCTVRPEPGRHHSQPLLGETGVFVHAGAMLQLVEVHTTLDKVVTRPIDIAALFDRATPAPSLPALRVPAVEDHALLVALHAATHDFTHAIAFLDLELLLRGGLDLQVLADRAREWRLTGVMFAMLSGMRQLGAASVDDALVARFDPGPLRRRVLARAASRGTSKPGLGWIAAQTTLRDDPLAWAVGVGRYAIARVRDREEPDGQASYRVPLWARAMLASDRVSLRLENLRASVCDEALLAWIPPERRDSVTAFVYSDLTTYLPGGRRFETGLFSWEERVLAMPAFPKKGRLLLGAAGAGRELGPLIARGFDVVAFDPCAPFVETARRLIPSGSSARMEQATYDDLVDAVLRRRGPLAPLLEGPPFDAIILSFGSLSHVMPSSARAELFRVLRTLAPDAPVLASFLKADPRKPKGKGRVRDTLRGVFAAVGAPGISEDGDHFLSSAGFFSYLAGDELRRIASETGYEVALFEDAPYPHLLLRPAREVEPRKR